MLTAIRDDEVAARSSGSRVGLARMLVFVVAAVGCGAAGALLAISQLQVQPAAVFSVQWTAIMAFVVIIGGLGTIEGPILGTIVYMVLQQTLASYNAWYLIILGLVAIVIALFARRGLWGLVDDHLHIRLFPVGYWLWTPETPAGRRGARQARDPPAPRSRAQLADGTVFMIVASFGRITPVSGHDHGGGPGRVGSGLGGAGAGENGRVLLSEIAEVSRAVAGTSARLAKIETLAAALREAGPLEVPIAVAYLSGELPQRQIGVGWAALRDGFAPAEAPTLTLSEVDSGFSAIGAVSGKGSAAARKALVGELFGRATADEQRFLVGLLSGELRQGALEGVMTEAVARAADVPVAEVRRAMMLRGSLGVVAAAALAGGSAALAAFGLEVGRPVRPMLAASAPSIEDALAKAGAPAAVEWKLDGIRIQAHLSGGDVRLFTRTLDDITARLPEVVAVLAQLPVTRRGARRRADRAARGRQAAAVPGHRVPHRQLRGQRAGRPAVAVPVRRAAPGGRRPDRRRGPAAARRAGPGGAGRACSCRAWSRRRPRRPRRSSTDALAHGHEGVVVKSLTAPYAAGRRGAGWIKVKPRHTLDLVVLAVEWGHGRRRGWLSNLHLGARDPATGGFVMLGKTFKGLTDELLTWQTSNACWRWKSAATPTPSTSAPNWSRRSPSTACSAAPATRAASRCGSPACCATARTRRPRRRTRSTPCARSVPAN